MKTLQEKLQERAALLDQMKAISAAAGNRDLNTSEARQFFALDAKVSALDATLPSDVQIADEIEKAVKTRDFSRLEALLDAPVAAARRPAMAVGNEREESADQGGRPIMGSTPRTWENLFGKPQGGHGFKSFNDFVSTIRSGRVDQRLQVIKAETMTVGSPANGGFVVPAEHGAWLMDASLEDEIVRPRATIWPMEGLIRKAPAWDGSDHTSNLFGGFSGVWLAEAGTATQQKAKLRMLQLMAHKLGIYTQTSNELKDDGTDFAAQLGMALFAAIGWYLDLAYLTGNGVGKPLGILNDPALVVVAKETGQAADTVVYTNLAKMFARMHPRMLKGAEWFANQTLIPMLLELSVSVGTGGSHIPVMTETAGVFRILGKPVTFTEKLPTAGDQGDILFANMSQYQIGMRKEIGLEMSNAPGWTEDLSDWRALVRTDGQGAWNTAITPKNGDSVSWCVTLAAR